MLRLRPRRWPGAAVALALAALVAADHKGWLLVRGPGDLSTYHEASVHVTRVIDGDLLEVDMADRLLGRPQTQVRLWGVQCPRPAGSARAAEALADEAREHARRLAEGETVALALEPLRTRGELGRILAHVRLPDGSSLNESLLAAGLARADDRLPHALLGRYEAIEQEAKRGEIGMWKKEKATKRRSDGATKGKK